MMTTTPNPSEEQIEKAATGIALYILGKHRDDLIAYWDIRPDLKRHDIDQFKPQARAALVAAGVAPQEPLGDLVFRAAAAIAETQARRQNLPPEVIQGVTREHIQDAKAALTAAGVAPQEPNQTETKSGNNFVSLDPEKVAEVIEQMRDRARKERDVTKESLGQFIARALCEAYTEGKLT